jgi:hypothetical protein
MALPMPIRLLPSDTHRKSIAHIKAVLLPFVTCLLTLPHTFLILKKMKAGVCDHYAVCVSIPSINF